MVRVAEKKNAEKRQPRTSFKIRNDGRPMSREYGTFKAVINKTVIYGTVKTRFWPWLSGKSPSTFLGCFPFARKGPLTLGTLIPEPRTLIPEPWTLNPEP